MGHSPGPGGLPLALRLSEGLGSDVGQMLMERMMHRHERLEKSRHAVPSGAQTEAKHENGPPEERAIAGLPKRRDGTATATSANATTGCPATGLAGLCRAPTFKLNSWKPRV